MESRERSYMLSDHKPASKKEDTKNRANQKNTVFVGHCWTDEVDTEMHFLLQCKSFSEVTNIYFNKFNSSQISKSCVLW